MRIGSGAASSACLGRGVLCVLVWLFNYHLRCSHQNTSERVLVYSCSTYVSDYTSICTMDYTVIIVLHCIVLFVVGVKHVKT